MSFHSFFTEIALQHIADTCQYYDSLPYENIADKFLTDIDNTVDHIERNPFVQLWTDEYRAFPLKKFPYLVFFEILEDQNLVKIVAVFHTSQDPDKYPL